MANIVNSEKNINEFEFETCLICLENISTQKWCKCIRCNIILHDVCEEIYRGKKGYTECPHCRRIGTIGSYK
jgi:hypothetical protein